MQIHILSIGHERTTIETELYQSYIDRTTHIGRKLGLKPPATHELRPPKGNNKDQEATLLDVRLDALKRKSKGQSVVVALDEKGTQFTSTDFAQWLADWQMRGAVQIVFVLGGADGLKQSFIDDANMVLSFGQMTWPHLLIRIMLAEQLWRSVSILTNHPYHRT